MTNDHDDNLLRQCGEGLTRLGEFVRVPPVRRPRRRRLVVPLLLASLAGTVALRDLLLPGGGGPTPAAAAAAAPGSVAPAALRGAVPALVTPVTPPAVAASPLELWLAQPVEPVRRNLFRLPDNETHPRAAALAAEAGPGRSIFQQKSPGFHADGSQRREALPADRGTTGLVPADRGRTGTGRTTGRQRPPERQQQQSPADSGDRRRRQARQIRLQSTMETGAGPMALVDGRLVREGDVVATGTGSDRAGYRVLRIEARRILLEREGVRLEVGMDTMD